MQRSILFFILIALLNSCKQGAPSSPTRETIKSTPQAIASAYGIEHWDAVNEIRFTFNVDRGDFHSERRFHWKPKTDEIVYIANDDTLSYTRGGELDSLQTAADQRFINDKYWLLVPFQLIWDPNLNFTEKQDITAPISKETLNQLTLVYPSEGGYTPGDAYDLYYDENYRIQEWSFRRGNQPEPDLTMTWEAVEEHNGLFFATMHRDSLDRIQISFTNIHVE